MRYVHGKHERLR